MGDESSRRPPLQSPGRRIRLADGRFRLFPAPPTSADPHGLRSTSEYDRLLDAMSEAEPEGEQFLAELAFAVYLLSLEEDLGPSDYQELLDFAPGSLELREWRAEMAQLIGEHLRARPHPTSAHQAPTKSPPQGWLARVLARFRLSPTV